MRAHDARPRAHAVPSLSHTCRAHAQTTSHPTATTPRDPAKRVRATTPAPCESPSAAATAADRDAEMARQLLAAAFAEEDEEDGAAQAAARTPSPPPPPPRVPRVSAADVDGPFLAVTGSDARRVYCPLAPPRPRDGGVAVLAADCTRGATLLSASLAHLAAAAERDAVERAVAAADDREAAETAEADVASGRVAAPPSRSARLWTDAHAPHTFLDLLSDEGINRDVLRWMKAWHVTVFGGNGAFRPPRRRAPVDDDPSALTFSPDGRPLPRLLLLAGPPGLGKTTLAHVVARHCGYRPVEVNASDDRGAATLGARVRDATEMESVCTTGGRPRPNCVIVDEIDGVSGGADGRGAIAALLKIALAGDGGSGAPDGTTRRRTRGPRPLRRPIICVCNDPYVPSLRPLRGHALLVKVPPPPTSRVVARLAAVCAAEGVAAERRALARVVTAARGDVRSCLHALQMLASRGGGQVTDAAAAALKSGAKDSKAGPLDAVGGVLCARAATGAAAVNPATATATTIASLYSDLMDVGDADLVLRCVHETLPTVRLADRGAHRAAAAADALSHGDALMAASSRRADWTLLRYAPVAPLTVRAAVAGPDRVRGVWPAASADATRGVTAARSLLSSWRARVSPTAFSGLTPTVAATDVVPYLLRVLAAPHRPVAHHLLSVAEKDALAATVATLAGYGLTFAPNAHAASRDDDDEETANGGKPGDLELDPPLHEAAPLAAGPLAPPPPSAVGVDRGLTQPARAMLASELAKEVIRRREARWRDKEGGGKEGGGGAATQSARRPPSGAPLPLTVAQRAAESGAARAAAAAAVAAASAPRKLNWLEAARGRAARQRRGSDCGAGGGADAAAVAAAAAAAAARKVPRAAYRFNEGYTNDVRRPLKLSDLM